MKELTEIQSRLKVPKKQKNIFGNYNYRSCEDILEAAKPYIAELNCSLIIDDKIVLIGDRFYIEATAKLRNESNETVMTSAYARESESKKGMDSAQLTGATSSYARKYALNGLFCIDDTEDLDGNEGDKGDKKTPKKTKPAIDIKDLMTDKTRSFIKKFPTAQDAINKFKTQKTVDDKTSVRITEIWESEPGQ